MTHGRISIKKFSSQKTFAASTGEDDIHDDDDEINDNEALSPIPEGWGTPFNPDS